MSNIIPYTTTFIGDTGFRLRFSQLNVADELPDLEYHPNPTYGIKLLHAEGAAAVLSGNDVEDVKPTLENRQRVSPLNPCHRCRLHCSKLVTICSLLWLLWRRDKTFFRTAQYLAVRRRLRRHWNSQRYCCTATRHHQCPSVKACRRQTTRALLSASNLQLRHGHFWSWMGYIMACHFVFEHAQKLRLATKRSATSISSKVSVPTCLATGSLSSTS